MARWRLYGLEDLKLHEIEFRYENGVSVVYSFFQDDAGYWRWNRSVERHDVNRRSFVSERGFVDKPDTIKDALDNAALYDRKLE